jgi:hypothetical protein
MNTGENEQGLRKIMDLTRMLSVSVLCLHLYLYCYQVFNQWGLSSGVTDRILLPVSRMKIFENWWLAKGGCLLLLAVSLVGVKGKKDQKLAGKIINSSPQWIHLLPGLPGPVLPPASR